MRTEFTKEEAVNVSPSTVVLELMMHQNAGAKNGDTVRIFEYEFEFID